jgi:hypothetical protein
LRKLKEALRNFPKVRPSPCIQNASTLYLPYKLFLLLHHQSFWMPYFTGYLKFGINTDDDATVYREWAPAAQ